MSRHTKLNATHEELHDGGVEGGVAGGVEGSVAGGRRQECVFDSTHRPAGYIEVTIHPLHLSSTPLPPLTPSSSLSPFSSPSFHIILTLTCIYILPSLPPFVR